MPGSSVPLFVLIAIFALLALLASCKDDDGSFGC